MKLGILLCLSLITLSSCSYTKVDFVPVEKVAVGQKPIESVELLLIKPRRAAICLGVIRTNGNEFASQDDAVCEAKKKAALLGADFILMENSGTNTTTSYNPGYSNYQSNGSACVNGNNASVYGSAAQNTTASSVGPSVTTLYFPWAAFSAWVYRPSTAGIDLNDDCVVTGFHLHTHAERAGIIIGDKVLGIDGYDIRDESLGQHLMTICVGNQMTYSISRDGRRMDFTFPAIKN